MEINYLNDRNNFVTREEYFTTEGAKMAPSSLSIEFSIHCSISSGH